MPVTEYLRLLLERRAKRKNPATSEVAWWGWHAMYEQMEKFVADFVRHPTDQPVTPATLAKLRRVMTALKHDLDDNRSF